MHFIANLSWTWPLWLIIIVAIIIGGFLALIFVVLPLLIFLAGIFEICRISRFKPAPPEEQLKPNRSLDAAISSGYTLIGHFIDGDKGIKRGVHTFALSPDGVVLLRLIRGRFGLTAFQLITRYPGRHWLVSTRNAGPFDQSGLDDVEALLDADFQLLLEHHLSRLRLRDEKPIPFLADCVLADVMQHESDRVDRMVELGVARWTSPQRVPYKHTFRGALRLATQLHRRSGKIRRVSLPQQLTQAEWDLVKQSPR